MHSPCQVSAHDNNRACTTHQPSCKGGMLQKTEKKGRKNKDGVVRWTGIYLPSHPFHLESCKDPSSRATLVIITQRVALVRRLAGSVFSGQGSFCLLVLIGSVKTRLQMFLLPMIEAGYREGEVCLV